MLPFNPNLLIPWGYGTQYVTLQYAWSQMIGFYEPEYLRRLFRWLTFKNGAVGVGGRHRLVQPVLPGHAPPGMSFHELQLFNDGVRLAMAVDLVKPDGPDGNHDHDSMTVADAPQQGSPEAKVWGVHINTNETWHMQAIEVDGFQSWVAAGRKHPKPNYPIPPYGVLDAGNSQEDDDMPKPMLITDGVSVYATDGTSISGVGGDTILANAIALGLFANSVPILVPREEIDATLRTE